MTRLECDTTTNGDSSIEHQVAALSSRLVSIKEAAPGSQHHKHALKELMGVLASNKGAIDILSKQQGAVQKEDGI